MNKRSPLIGILIPVMACLMLVASCTAKKKLVSPMAHAKDYEWMTAKMTMDISTHGMEFHDISGVLRMRRDSTIWISASAFMGMETIRTRITTDSVILINRFENTYLAEPLQKAAQAFNIPMTLPEVQAKLLGNGSSDKVDLQFGPYLAKIRYSDIHWDEPTTFPIKIKEQYQRMKL